jgi:hypothetical protein
VATKADNAEMPELLWDDRIKGFDNTDQRDVFLKNLRSLALRWWKKNVWKDFLKWFKLKYPCLGPQKLGQFFPSDKIAKHKEANKDWLAG